MLEVAAQLFAQWFVYEQPREEGHHEEDRDRGAEPSEQARPRTCAARAPGCRSRLGHVCLASGMPDRLQAGRDAGLPLQVQNTIGHALPSVSRIVMLPPRTGFGR
jgi:hypothetical protein